MAVSDSWDDDDDDVDPAVAAAEAAAHAAALEAAAKADAAATAEVAAIVQAALEVHARDAAAGERVLIDALHALAVGGDMHLHVKKVRARPLMLALFELATPTAVDVALDYAVSVEMRDDTVYSDAAWTAILERLLVRWPNWQPQQVQPIIWKLVRPMLYGKRVDDLLLALLCTIIDDPRASIIDRDGMVKQILHRIDVDDFLYLYKTTPEMRAHYRAALAARANDRTLAVAPIARALLLGDPAEAYVELAERYRNNAEWRKAIVEHINEKADPRFIDEAVRIASVDPRSATRTLGKMRTPRAIEELLHWADTAESGGAFDDLVRDAIRALGEACATNATPAIVRWIERRDLKGVVYEVFYSLTLTARREHLPLLDALSRRDSEDAAHFAELAARIRSSP